MKKRITIFFITSLVLLSIAGIGHAMCEPLKFKRTGLSSQQVHEIVKQRIASGKDLNLPIDEVRDENNKRYSYPIILCCSNNPPQTATLELLFHHNANPNMLDFTINNHDFPIDIICKSLSSHTHIHALRLLLNAGADLRNGNCLIDLCQNPQNEAILKNPELRVEAMQLLVASNTAIPYHKVLLAILESLAQTAPKPPQYEILLQERKDLLRILLRTNVSIFSETNSSYFDIAIAAKNNRLNTELIKFIQNHETERCKSTDARYRSFLEIEKSRVKDTSGTFAFIPENVIKQIILFAYPKMSNCS